ncbi:MAG: hypothetical protein ABI680_07970, partial [Chthoniobacteraceae bacterium]
MPFAARSGIPLTMTSYDLIFRTVHALLSVEGERATLPSLKMSRYATYPSTTTPPMARKWIFRALMLSLLIHAVFLTFAYLKRLDNFGFNNAAPPPPPSRFVVQQTKIDPKLLESSEEITQKIADQKPTPHPDITVPMDKPEAQDIQLSPVVKEIQSPVLEESPKAKPINWEDVKRTEAISAGSDDQKLGSLAAAMLNESVAAPNQPTIKFPAGTKFGDAADGGTEGIPGRQSVDDALARTGPLPAGDKPIAMPGGALFDYDKADLRPEALTNLQKLGELIRRNPGATFRIEG